MEEPGAAGARQFRGVLEHGSRALGWTVVRVPFDPHEAWPGMVRLRVAGEVNGCRFRTSLCPDAAMPGRFVLLVNRAVQREAGLALGTTAELRLWPDLEERPAELPDALAVLLDEEAGLRAWYDGLSEYTRREIGKWVAGVKSDAARERRAMQMAERLLATMEAEWELPPLIARALAGNARAQAAWSRMSLTHRRQHLMAVFCYQTPEARAKRVAKLVVEAAAGQRG